MTDDKNALVAFIAFPPAHWSKIWSNNPLERLNKEVKRRSNVVGIYPNDRAAIRLIGDVVGVDDPEPGWLVVAVAVREERPVCGRCGTTAWVEDHREVDLVDLPAFDQRVTLRVIRTRWRCPTPPWPNSPRRRDTDHQPQLGA